MTFCRPSSLSRFKSTAYPGRSRLRCWEPVDELGESTMKSRIFGTGVQTGRQATANRQPGRAPALYSQVVKMCCSGSLSRSSHASCGVRRIAPPWNAAERRGGMTTKRCCASLAPHSKKAAVTLRLVAAPRPRCALCVFAVHTMPRRAFESLLKLFSSIKESATVPRFFHSSSASPYALSLPQSRRSAKIGE